MNSTYAIPVWPYVYGLPAATGKIRVLPTDFIVGEQLSFMPSGTGEHVFLQIRKTGENTEFVARKLARFAGVRQRDIGFAGLKDRHAVTTQWFSVWLPGKSEPEWQEFGSDSLAVLQNVRHARKLKRGALSGNRFLLTVRDWQGDQQQTGERLQAIKANGIANYYGEQRFGNGGQNVLKALAMFAGTKVPREQQSIYLSAARSFLFNQLLAARIEQNSWDQAVTGDYFMFDGSHSGFKSTEPDAQIHQRLRDGKIHPAGILWGKGEFMISATAEQIARQLIKAYPELAEGLLAYGLEIDTRPLRVNVSDLEWQFPEPDVLVLSFSLPAGSYATAVLREVVRLTADA